MGRPSLAENAVYVQTQSRLEPVKKILDDAKEECSLIMRRAERQVEDETLGALWWGVQNGLSQYAVGKLMGKTRAEHQRELFERVNRWGGANPEIAATAPGVVDVAGWLFGPAGAAGVNEHGHHTPFVAPDGTRYTVAYGDDHKCHWYFSDGTRLTFDQCDALLTFEVEEYARANAL
jgi:hypothetical protein